MSETSKDQKNGWFKGVKAEIKKIIWPSKKDLAKQTAVVLISALVIGVIVAIIDMGIQYGIDALINL
ncbi:MAG: preprotein translocase subunit SecE [Lachnospiraceae bacterium]|nr:preprotein translocase subunit SecE [Lachnospiraceae bacterium]